MADGTGLHRSTAGLRQIERGHVLVVPPGTWHGYEDCDDLVVHGCKVSRRTLARELAWTRTDPLLSRVLSAPATRDAGQVFQPRDFLTGPGCMITPTWHSSTDRFAAGRSRASVTIEQVSTSRRK